MADIAGLEEFVALSAQNRDFALFFSGLEGVFGELRKRTQAVVQAASINSIPEGSTTIIQGCPGMGKTSLLRRFIDLCNEDYSENGKNGFMPLPIQIHVSEATNLKSVLDKAIHANPSNHSMKWISSLKSDFRDRLKDSPTLENFLELLKPATGDQALVILIDEIQNAAEKNSEFLTSLHEGRIGNFPILPLYFGLNSSKSQLETLGLSRLGDQAVINLGVLTVEDCMHSFQSMLDEYEVEKNELTEEWIHSMVEDSQCFPHHLTAALRATASALVDSQGYMYRDGLNIARKEAETYRLNFYKDRVGLLFTLPEEAVGALARRLTTDPLVLEKHPVRAAEALLDILTEADIKRIDIEAARSMLQTMIHRGILQLNSSLEHYEIPIPAFQTWAAQHL